MRNDHVQGNLSFKLMSLEFCIRDILSPPEKLLREAGVCTGMTVMDFGCGPGGFSIAAAHLVGNGGMVYAVDIHPLALQSVTRTAKQKKLSNVYVTNGEHINRIPDASVDIVLLYDVLHDIPEPVPILDEIRRVLKTDGLLSVSDHHLKEASILDEITLNCRFRYTGRDHHAFRFKHAEAGEAGE